MNYACRKVLSNILYKNKSNTYLMKNIWNVKKMTGSLSFNLNNYLNEDEIFNLPSINHYYSITKVSNGMSIICDERNSTDFKLCIHIDVGSRDENNEYSGVLNQIANNSNKFINKVKSDYTMKFDEENMLFTLNTKLENSGNEIFPQLFEKIFNLNYLLNFEENTNDLREETQNIDFHQLLLTTAFGFNTLGMPKHGFFLNRKSIDKYICQSFLVSNITPEKITVFTNNPKNLNIIKDTLEEYNPVQESKFERDQSVYIGGEVRTFQEKNETSMILAFPSIEKSDKLSLVFELLHFIFGETNYKNQYLEQKHLITRRSNSLMEEYKFIREFKSINLCYSDNGLFGLSITGESNYAKQLFDILIQQIKRMSLITSEELMFAKNYLTHSFTKNINDSRDNHDIVTSFYRYNKNLSFEDYLTKLHSIDTIQIKEIVEKMLSEKPTFIVRGNKMNLVPNINEYFPL